MYWPNCSKSFKDRYRRNPRVRIIPSACTEDSYKEYCKWEYPPGSSCKEEFTNLTDFSEHVKKHVYQLPEDAGNTCRWRYCSRIPPLMDRNALFIHVRDHTEENAIRCFYKKNGCYKLFETFEMKKGHSKHCRFNESRNDMP